MKKTIIIILTLLMNLGLSAQEKKLASDVPSKIDAPKPVKVRKMKGAVPVLLSVRTKRNYSL